jgi:hypothetical protein
MVVHNLNLGGVRLNPAKANPPLVIDPDTVLTCVISSQALQAIPRITNLNPADPSLV